MKTFTQDVSTSGNLQINGSINNIDVSEEILTLDGSQTITRDVTVANIVGMGVVGDITMLGNVNSIDLSTRALQDTGDMDISGK